MRTYGSHRHTLPTRKLCRQQILRDRNGLRNSRTAANRNGALFVPRAVLPGIRQVQCLARRGLSSLFASVAFPAQEPAIFVWQLLQPGQSKVNHIGIGA
jgi:hypothetical protein